MQIKTMSIVAIIVIAIIQSCTTTSWAGISGDEALQSSKSGQLAHSQGYNSPSPYSEIPVEDRSGGFKDIISGSCKASSGSSRTCHIATGKSWLCSMSGATAMGESEHGRVYFSGNNWYAHTYRGGWQAEVFWTCLTI